MDKLLIVGLGGFAGSILRYLAYLVFDKPYLSIYPWATFTVNILGSFILGILYAVSIKYSWFNEQWRLLLMIGFCGSFTTFSTFAWEGFTMMKAGHLATTLLYLSLSVIGSFGAVFLGYWIVK